MKYSENKPKPKVPLTCAICGETKMVTSWQKYKWRWGYDGEKYCEKCFREKFAKCCVCGKTLVDRYYFDFSHITSQYCSSECRKIGEAEHARRVGRMSKCAICGKEFPNYNTLGKYCSDECRAEAVKRKKTKKEKYLEESPNE